MSYPGQGGKSRRYSLLRPNDVQFYYTGVASGSGKIARSPILLCVIAQLHPATTIFLFQYPQ